MLNLLSLSALAMQLKLTVTYCPTFGIEVYSYFHYEQAGEGKLRMSVRFMSILKEEGSGTRPLTLSRQKRIRDLSPDPSRDLRPGNRQKQLPALYHLHACELP